MVLREFEKSFQLFEEVMPKISTPLPNESDTYTLWQNLKEISEKQGSQEELVDLSDEDSYLVVEIDNHGLGYFLGVVTGFNKQTGEIWVYGQNPLSIRDNMVLTRLQEPDLENELKWEIIPKEK